MKKVSIGAKPSGGSRRPTPDDWVQDREGGNQPIRKDVIDEPIKRLTIDIPVGLHTRVKSQCALQNLRMADVIREMLEKKFPAGAAGEGPQATPLQLP